MRIESISYSEYKGEPKEWTLETTTFDTVNLIVGKNASGKSRLLNVTSGLAKMLRGEKPSVYQTGEYVVDFRDASNRIRYEVAFRNQAVQSEMYSINGTVRLQRGANGVGKIWAEKIQQDIDFEAPPNVLAAQSRRDAIQHPFFEDLHAWARDLRHLQFGTPLGRDHLFIISQPNPSTDKESEITDPSQVARLYATAYAEFKDEFDSSVLRDLASLGYDCTDVGLESPGSDVVQGPPLFLLYVQERDLRTKTYQIQMSQGMFRALSLVIQLNYWIFRNKPRTLLIDDIGEGLDFRRAQSFIALLIERCQKNNIQLIMTSNDRFVMNGVPLKYWGVLTRNGHSVSISNIRNSEKIFREFEELGLNNFDFFSTNFFEEGMK